MSCQLQGLHSEALILLVIAHRVNTSEQLKVTPEKFGVEVDVRSSPSGLILSHDPFYAGESLNEWLREFRHQLLVINVKEDGLESRVLEQIELAGITEYFFLDQAMPTLIRTIGSGNPNVAIRVSEFEPIEKLKIFQGLADWVWLDSFKPSERVQESIVSAASLGFKVCLVSPELHSPEREVEARQLANQLLASKNLPYAICTKLPKYWSLD